MADRWIRKAQSEFQGNHGVTRTSTSNGAGLWTYQEEVELAGIHSTTDNDVLVYLSKTLPANAVVISAAMTVTELSDLTTVGLNLYCTDDQDEARDAVVTGATHKELCGAGADAGNTGDLEAGSGAALGDTEAGHGPVNIATKVNLVICQGDANTAGTSTAGKILVTVVYAGSAPPADV